MRITEGPAAPAAYETAAAGDGARFLLWPHRSLPGIGLALLLTSVTLAATLPTLYVALMHGFGGALLMIGVPCLAMPVALALAFRANNRAAGMCETVAIVDGRLHVRTTRPGAPDRVSTFNPYWVRVEVIAHASGDNRVVLAEGCRRLAIGTFLSAEERVAFAEALRARLRAHRRSDSGRPRHLAM